MVYCSDQTHSSLQKAFQQKCASKFREEKLQAKIKVLETLATETTEENEIEKMEIEKKKKLEEEDLVRLRKHKESSDSQVIALKEALARPVK
ncbi:kinesin-like protein KIN-14J [Apium graveolens]|uniref:kinesin-like protein KIN-14J n=1 Tax=Apium graveolens TaxID=4045 RepID=UPI003D79794A